MSDTDPAVELLRDSFERIRELVVELCDGLDVETGAVRLDPDANSPAWLLWHLTRVQDDHVADLAGVDQAWTTWRERLDLPFGAEDIGYGHDSEQVGAVRIDGATLAGYHADVHDLTLRYVQALTPDELARVVDDRWDPPVTASARLVSVVGDCLQHAGQAAFVLGVVGRRD